MHNMSPRYHRSRYPFQQSSLFILMLICIQATPTLALPQYSTFDPSFTPTRETSGTVSAGIGITQYPPKTAFPATEAGTLGVSLWSAFNPLCGSDLSFRRLSRLLKQVTHRSSLSLRYLTLHGR